MFIDTRTKDSQEPTEIKSLNFPAMSFADFLADQGLFSLSAIAAIQMYVDAQPLYNAIDMRAQAFSDIPIRLKDTKKDVFVDEHEVLDLLNQPNGDTTGQEFLYQVASFFDITGNSLMFAGGRINNPPLELAVVPPQGITFASASSRFGILHVPDSISINSSVGRVNEVFRANDTGEKNLIRYLNDSADRELWHIRQFNPLRNATQFWGMSRARPLWLEIQQYLSGNNTNWSLLKRGTRLSMAWVNNRGEELTDKQWERMQEEAQKYAGDMNAGGTPILDGMDVKLTQQSLRDMEFKDLQDSMIRRISNNYNIPLALILDSTMTLNNLETSMLQLYDRAVIPLTNYIYAELDRFLLPRYKNTENLKFAFYPDDIEALRVRTVESVKKQAEIGINTINELRTALGDEALGEGGDVLHKPSINVPVASDQFTEDNLAKPIKKMEDLDRDHVTKLLERIKDGAGDRRYTDDQIKSICDEKGIGIAA